MSTTACCWSLSSATGQTTLRRCEHTSWRPLPRTQGCSKQSWCSWDCLAAPAAFWKTKISRCGFFFCKRAVPFSRAAWSVCRASALCFNHSVIQHIHYSYTYFTIFIIKQYFYMIITTTTWYHHCYCTVSIAVIIVVDVFQLGMCRATCLCVEQVMTRIMQQTA